MVLLSTVLRFYTWTVSGDALTGRSSGYSVVASPYAMHLYVDIGAVFLQTKQVQDLCPGIGCELVDGSSKDRGEEKGGEQKLFHDDLLSVESK